VRLELPRDAKARAFSSACRFDVSQPVLRNDMTDTLSKAERSARISRVRAKDTKPELRVRRLVHRMGYRYRLHRQSLPGKPDLVFGPRRKLIFVHGCFWHRHDDPACRLARVTKSHTDFWLPKLEGNKARDKRTVIELRKLGWDALVIWECQTRNEDEMRRTISQFLDDAQ
jgi:DNA mismatch endonuclease (patch repair protein)